MDGTLLFHTSSSYDVERREVTEAKLSVKATYFASKRTFKDQVIG